jgi:uncharacterized membrane protein
MQSRERMFHAVSFELIAMAFIVPISAIVMKQNSADMLLVSIALSVFAVLWNYVYNLWFDSLFGAQRLARTLFIRGVHVCGFEGGMLIITIPSVSWYLGLTLVDTLMLEAGLLAFLFTYTFIFNWLYDVYQPYQRWFVKRVY